MIFTSSFWIDSVKDIDIKENIINQDCTADVCVIGAGICGLTTAYYLSKKGLKVIVVDKDNIGNKASGNTTAKITLQHGLIYDYLIKSFGLNFAIKYYGANKNAIGNIKKIIDDEKIECDFEYQPNYIYTTTDDGIDKIKKEVSAINAIDAYIDASNPAKYVNKIELPIQSVGAIKIVNQAQFNPSKYMIGLAKSIEKNGGVIYINSVVHDIKKNDSNYICLVNDKKIESKYVVMAAHYPFINFPGFYFSKMYQVTSYVIGIETEKPLFNGMYITDKEPTLSFRTAKNGDKRLLIVAGRKSQNWIFT